MKEFNLELDKIYTLLIVLPLVNITEEKMILWNKLVEYKNNNNLNAKWDCCENNIVSICRFECHSKFTICISSISKPNQCIYTKIVTNVYPYGKEIQFKDILLGNVNNQIVVEMDSTKDIFYSIHVETNQGEAIATFIENPLKLKLNSYSNQSIQNIEFELRQRRLVKSMSVQFKLNCQEFYLLPDCRIYCKPRDDEGGHYECLDNVGKVCIDGWMGVSSNCTTRNESYALSTVSMNHHQSTIISSIDFKLMTKSASQITSQIYILSTFPITFTSPLQKATSMEDSTLRKTNLFDATLSRLESYSTHSKVIETTTSADISSGIQVKSSLHYIPTLIRSSIAVIHSEGNLQSAFLSYFSDVSVTSKAYNSLTPSLSIIFMSTSSTINDSFIIGSALSDIVTNVLTSSNGISSLSPVFLSNLISRSLHSPVSIQTINSVSSNQEVDSSMQQISMSVKSTRSLDPYKETISNSSSKRLSLFLYNTKKVDQHRMYKIFFSLFGSILVVAVFALSLIWKRQRTRKKNQIRCISQYEIPKQKAQIDKIHINKNENVVAKISHNNALDDDENADDGALKITRFDDMKLLKSDYRYQETLDGRNGTFQMNPPPNVPAISV